MKRSECWMTFTEALEMYLKARTNEHTAPAGCQRYNDALHDMQIAQEHMDTLVGSEGGSNQQEGVA